MAMREAALMFCWLVLWETDLGAGDHIMARIVKTRPGGCSSQMPGRELRNPIGGIVCWTVQIVAAGQSSVLPDTIKYRDAAEGM